uniref:Uncharacterized protein TCIL3000_10_13170 n=1 Tax=Trypanosoma congolense (strain IL3000) TaxID=1068625 RepID=G0UYR7_TRYCI|nr:unnamed protein product [Trypanosoma congolense IL3000]
MPVTSPRSANAHSGRRVSAFRRATDGEFRRTNSMRSVSSPRQRFGESMQCSGNAMDVYVRVRPFNQRELASNMPLHSTVRIDVDNPCVITLLDPQKDFRARLSYNFTKCFWSVIDGESDDCSNAGELINAIRTYIDHRSFSPRRTTPRYNAGASSRSQSARAKGSGDLPSNVCDITGSGAALLTGVTVPHPPYGSQLDVYKVVGRPLLENALEGYNGCIFAYGQTGSGKTFTMLGYTPRVSDLCRKGNRNNLSISDVSVFGSQRHYHRRTPSGATSGRRRQKPPRESSMSLCDAFNTSMNFMSEAEPCDTLEDGAPTVDPNDLRGIIPRIVEDLFERLCEMRYKEGFHSCRVKMEFYEIYNEKVYDLISSQKDADLRIRHHPLTGPYVEGLSAAVVRNEEQVAELINRGNAERHTSCTRVNDCSSRSHAIIAIHLIQVSLDGDNNTYQKCSKLNLVDLAGSERIGASGVEGLHFKESTKINLSLTTLGRVIDCLAEISQNKVPSVPVPYRDSNLTWLLMDSLGGNSKTSMVATVSPHCSNFEEMQQTLRYASRAKQIVNVAVVNEDPQVRQIKILTSEIENLKKVIRENGMNEFTRDYVIDLEQRHNTLEKRCLEQQLCIVRLHTEAEDSALHDHRGDGTPSSGRTTRVFRTDMSGRHGRTHVSGDDIITSSNAFKTGPTGRNVENYWGSPAKTSPRKAGSGVANGEHVAEMSATIKRLKNEMEILRMDSHIQRWQVGQTSTLYTSKLLELVCETVTRKNTEFVSHIALLFNSWRGGRAVDVCTPPRRLNGGFHGSRGSSEINSCRFPEKDEKKDPDSYRSRGELSRGTESSPTEGRVADQKGIQYLPGETNLSLIERQRPPDFLRRLQYERDEIKRQKEEVDAKCREKDKEIMRLRRVLGTRDEKREEEASKSDEGNVSMEKLNALRSEMLKIQEKHKRSEQKSQADIQCLIERQDRLCSISNTLLSHWEGQSAALDSTFTQLRALLHSQDLQNNRFLQHETTMERRDYSAEVAAAEERNQRDTERFRDIVKRLRQNQEESKATIQRFEKDVMQHFSVVKSARSGRISYPNGNGSLAGGSRSSR